MQELIAPPQAPVPNAPMGGPQPPRLGTPVPGTTGGLPALAGLSAMNNQMPQQFVDETADVVASYRGGGAVNQAENVRQLGRGEDTVLVHMTPSEVGGLQALALAHGGSLTINPHTGLPEAGFLKGVFKKLLPTLVGFGLNFIPGVGPIAAAALTAAGGTALTGSLKKGLMAGLQAYGGASLSGALAPGATQTAAKAAAAAAPTSTAPAAAAPAATAGQTLAPVTAGAPGGISTNIGGLGALSPQQVAQYAAPQATAAAGKTGLAGIMQRFGQAATQGLPAGTPNIIRQIAPMAAGMGLMQGVGGALAPGGIKTATGQIDNSYQGPYTAQARNASFAPDTKDILSSSKERRYYDVDMPEIRNVQGQVTQPGSSTAPGTQIIQPMLNPKAKKGQNMYSFVPVTYRPDLVQGGGYAKGGEVELSDGAFVVDARTVSELGNGSSGAGQELLARLGGRPVRGPGDGVSDSVPARIGRDQPARVARDEVVIPADAVKRLGKGSNARGAKKLYSMMDKAHKARKKASRGQDTGLRRGLA